MWQMIQNWRLHRMADEPDGPARLRAYARRRPRQRTRALALVELTEGLRDEAPAWAGRWRNSARCIRPDAARRSPWHAAGVWAMAAGLIIAAGVGAWLVAGDGEPVTPAVVEPMASQPNLADVSPMLALRYGERFSQPGRLVATLEQPLRYQTRRMAADVRGTTVAVFSPLRSTINVGKAPPGEEKVSGSNAINIGGKSLLGE